MKHLFAIVAILALSMPCVAAESHKPIVRNGYVMRTIQQDAELKDWITGIVRVSQENQVVADVATKQTAQLKEQVDALAKHDQVQTDKVATLTTENETLKGRINKLAFAFAVAAGLFAGLLVTKLKVNPIYAVVVGMLISGAIFTWLRFLL